MPLCFCLEVKHSPEHLVRDSQTALEISRCNEQYISYYGIEVR